MGNVRFGWSELAAVCEGVWVIAPSPNAGNGVDGVVDDSRIVAPGNLFVAIRGELADGHRFLSGAARAGAAAALVETLPSEAVLSDLRASGCALLKVQDSLLAFQRLARAHRLTFSSLPLVGVTGSCGKTSTKEMCAAVLARRYGGEVVKTAGNTNNFFGAPRNLFRLTAETRAAVIETGSNHPGEIRRLADMVRPTTGIVCNIGAAHLEFFGDLLGVAEEKGDLLEALPDDGVAVVPGEAVGLDILKRHAGSRRLVTFGSGADNDMRGEYLGVNCQGYGLRLTWRETGESIELTWGIGGRHQAVNAAGAAAVGKLHGMSLAEIAEGLKACELPGARMKVEAIDGVNWVNDAYNANPSSMRASLEWLEEISAGASGRILVLGDMRELGAKSAEEHESLADYVLEHFGKDRIFLVGKLFSGPASSRGIRHFDSADEAKAALEACVAAGDWVFLKASNGIGLGRLMPRA